jgi:hypothetical protein
MIKILREGAGWSVKRDGQLVKQDGRSGVHKSKTSAYKYVLEIRTDPNEEIEIEGGLEGIDLERIEPSALT